MMKSEAIQLLGGTTAAVARAVGVTPSAVSQWPEVLTPALTDRVQAALWRQQRARKPRQLTKADA